MGALFEFLLLFVCWLAALATLLVFLETWFGLSGRNRLIARRASGAYGLISVFVPMYGGREKVLQTFRSVLGQSYPFIELVLIYCEENRQFRDLAAEFRASRSHIPVRVVATPFPIDSHNDRIRALETAEPSAHGRWFVILDPDILLDRFAIEIALEFGIQRSLRARSSSRNSVLLTDRTSHCALDGAVASDEPDSKPPPRKTEDRRV